jgi:hypothetical protein
MQTLLSPTIREGENFRSCILATGGDVMKSPAKYEIRIKGHLSDGVRSSFTGFDSLLQPAETVLFGSVTDQSALHGLLARLRSLGLELVEVRRLPDDIPSSETSHKL